LPFFNTESGFSEDVQDSTPAAYQRHPACRLFALSGPVNGTVGERQRAHVTNTGYTDHEKDLRSQAQKYIKLTRLEG